MKIRQNVYKVKETTYSTNGAIYIVTVLCLEFKKQALQRYVDGAEELRT